MDEYSDSEDEGDDRRNEKSYRDTKRPRLIEENSKNGGSRSTGTGRGQLLSSPLPPEPSPITPLPQDDNTEPKGDKALNFVAFESGGVYMHNTCCRLG